MKKINIFFFLILLISYSFCSCTKIIRDPATKYNREFLSKHRMVIREPKIKHRKIAKEFGIKYTDDIVENTVDSQYYKNTSIKEKKNFVIRSDKYQPIDIINENMEYLSQDKSIYKSTSNLRENKLDVAKNKNNTIAYLKENYSNYKQEQTNLGVEISAEALYGSPLDRRNKKYYIIDSDELLISYDYIDLLSRVRTDIYLQQKEQQQQEQQGSSLKQKIMNMFSGIGKKKNNDGK